MVNISHVHGSTGRSAAWSSDHKVTFEEYERAGVQEYWLLDPDRRTAEFYEPGADGRYRAAVIADDGIYRSKVIQGFWLRADWLSQMPLPQILDILRELKLV